MKPILTTVLLGLFLTNGVFPQNTNLQMGVSKINITPTDSIYLSGYGGMYSHRYTNRVNDSLYCRVTALKKENKKIVFISTDLIGSYFYEEVYAELFKNFKLKPEEVFLTAIHTHSAPAFTFSEKDRNTYNYAYTKELVDGINTAVKRALSDTKEVNVSIGSGYAPIGVNRRQLNFDLNAFPQDGGFVKLGINPEGITNNRITLIKFRPLHTDNSSSFFEFGCHARSQSPSSQVITGDFFGIAEQRAERILNNTVMSGFAGPSGDIDPPFVVGDIVHTSNSIPETELLGQMLAQELVRSYQSAQNRLEITGIMSTYKSIDLPSRRRDEYISNDSIPKTPLHLTTSSLSEDIVFVGIGAEVAVAIGNEIKNASPFKHTFIFTHCNGGEGYLSPKEFYKERGYEVLHSPYGPEAGDIVIKSILEELYTQHKKQKK
ncbi:MAG: neutral/alkaline non-lysosomal ceramidase N-terminal domain-containing protein [Bacteroidota bacterium]